MWNSGSTSTTCSSTLLCAANTMILHFFVCCYIYDLLGGHSDKGWKFFDLNGDCDNRPVCWGAILIWMLIDFCLICKFALCLFPNSYFFYVFGDSVKVVHQEAYSSNQFFSSVTLSLWISVCPLNFCNMNSVTLPSKFLFVD